MKHILTGFLISILLGAVLIWGGLRYLSNHNAEIERVNNLKKTDIQVTIVEGYRIEQIAQIMDQKGICKYADFINASEGNEGKLFPDTYRFFPSTPATDVVKTMLDNYAKKTASLSVNYRDLILASIVEREATNDMERPLIAGVYQNRLDIDMKLDADPTVQYAKEIGLGATGEYWEKITRDDYSSVISPYNTYLNKDLPPAPICNPGLKSIQAALNPSTHSYYYFLHKDGKLIMSRTLGEHNAAQL